MFDFEDTLNPHLVASVLKKYIRDRPFSTVPYRCYRSAILIHDSLPDKYAPFSTEECKSFIEHLPDDKQDLFRTVMKFVTFVYKCYSLHLLFIVSAFQKQVFEEDFGF